MAQKPFSEETVELILPMINNTDFVLELGNDLRRIFEVKMQEQKLITFQCHFQTDRGFDKKTFAKQLSVIRGQMFNLREALRMRKSPAQLVQVIFRMNIILDTYIYLPTRTSIR
jgi:phosphatidylinositol 4-kinase type 2